MGSLRNTGAVSASRASPGRATVFRVVLPVSAEASTGRALAAQTPPPAIARVAKTILVVDDEPGIASALAHLLRRDGHTVDTAANGQPRADQVVYAGL